MWGLEVGPACRSVHCRCVAVNSHNRVDFLMVPYFLEPSSLTHILPVKILFVIGSLDKQTENEDTFQKLVTAWSNEY